MPKRFRERLGGLAAVAAALFLLAPQVVSAAAYTVQARTEAQAYQFRGYRGSDPTDTVLIPRRRLVQYLGMDGFELVDKQDVGFESSLRIFADLGLPKGEAARLDGTNTEDVDLLYANLFYRTGNLETRFGRQVYIDLMDYMAFDGARLRYVRSVGPKIGRFGGEAYAGIWVKGANLLGSSVYQLDGTRETDARRIAAGVSGTDATLDAIEPVFGAKLIGEDIGALGINTTLGYRRSLLAGKITSERAAWELRYGKGRGINAWAGLDYDLFMGRVAQARAELRYDQELYAASVEALRFSPIFTADSIFYYFVSGPRDEVKLRGDWTPAGPFRFYASAAAAKTTTVINSALTALATAAEDPNAPASNQTGFGAGASARFEQARAAIDVNQRSGWGGNQLWLDLTGGFTSVDQRYTLDGRFSVASVKDQFNTLLNGTFYGFQVWGSYLLSPASRFSLVLEQNVNPFVRSDTKAFVLFDLRADL